MDIVGRLKFFLRSEDIAITQFADNCGIPRPSLSQLLNGRNKKVSDDFIRKIHSAYPSLSVLWLMFGEGDMIAPGYESDNRVKSVKDGHVGSENESVSDISAGNGLTTVNSNSTPSIDVVPNIGKGGRSIDAYTELDDASTYIVEEEMDNDDSHEDVMSRSASIDFGPSSVTDELAESQSAESGDDYSEEASEAEVIAKSIMSDLKSGSRKIVNIIVYYSDNSYESFWPKR